jgi:hypothetical protein
MMEMAKQYRHFDQDTLREAVERAFLSGSLVLSPESPLSDEPETASSGNFVVAPQGF